MTKLMFKNNVFDFNSNVKHYVSAAAIDSKLTPPNMCLLNIFYGRMMTKNLVFLIKKS